MALKRQLKAEASRLARAYRKNVFSRNAWRSFKQLREAGTPGV